MMPVTGRIHSLETCGMVDGPGIRFLIFTQGCPLRCLYCHNPDTWKRKGGEEVTAHEIIEKARTYKNYLLASGGGITITGGEPLFQADFVQALLLEAKAAGIHTAVDTSGFAPPAARKAVLPHADLVLLDIKSAVPTLFKKISGVSIAYTLATLNELKEWNVPVWIRHVIVPGLTDKPEDAEKLAQMLKGYPNIEKVEILPFHKMGEYKWEQLHEPYTLQETEAPSDELIHNIRTIFSRTMHIPIQ
jgi:pyruvate formate lyase activating enzyme